MENAALNLLPILQSNAVTMGLAANTVTELAYRGLTGQSEVGALLQDIGSAALLGLASAMLPEIGINTSPELTFYAAMIGFNLPTLIKVMRGSEPFWQTSLPMGAAFGALGAGADYIVQHNNVHSVAGIPLNVNQFVKNVFSTFSGSK